MPFTKEAWPISMPFHVADWELDDLYAQHAELVWKSLARLGVREADVPDMLQEVFIVAFRKRASFDASCKPSSWLFGICLRVASGYRWRLGNRRERAQDETKPGPMSWSQPRWRVLAGALWTKRLPDRGPARPE